MSDSKREVPKTLEEKKTILETLAKAVTNALHDTESNAEVKQNLETFRKQVIDPMKKAIAAGEPVPDPELILEAYHIREKNKLGWEKNQDDLFVVRVHGALQSVLPIDRLPELMDLSSRYNEKNLTKVVEILKEDKGNIKIMQQSHDQELGKDFYFDNKGGKRRI